MKRADVLLHLAVPALVAFLALLLSLRREPLTLDLTLTHLAWGTLFYASPHLLWAVVALAIKPVLLVWHLGFAASSLALLSIGALSIWGPRDPSGLPYQWLVYWPLATGLLVVVVLGWVIAGRPRAGA